jgi:hypothetical protein
MLQDVIMRDLGDPSLHRDLRNYLLLVFNIGSRQAG